MSTLLRIRDVLALVGLKRSTMYLYIKQGEFPAPVKLGVRSSAWRDSEIQSWIESRRTASVYQKFDQLKEKYHGKSNNDKKHDPNQCRIMRRAVRGVRPIETGKERRSSGISGSETCCADHQHKTLGDGRSTVSGQRTEFLPAVSSDWESPNGARQLESAFISAERFLSEFARCMARDEPLQNIECYLCGNTGRQGVRVDLMTIVGRIIPVCSTCSAVRGSIAARNEGMPLALQEARWIALRLKNKTKVLQGVNL